MPRVAILLGSQGHGSGAERVLEYLLQGAVGRREAIRLVAPRSSSVVTCARDLGYAWTPWEAEDDALRANACTAWRHYRSVPPSGGCEIVHSWHTRHLEWAVALGRLWQISRAGTIHDDPAPAHAQFGYMRKRIIRHAAHGLNGLAVVSQAVADRCRALGWTCPISILRNGLPDLPPLPRSSGVPAPLRIGFLATGVLWKGIDLIPELVQTTENLGLEWNLFGPASNETASVIERLKGMPRVKYFGRVPLAEALPHMDVLLHLSRNLDPYPTVLLEAARAGLPVIATATGGSPEIVAHGETGLLVAPGDVSGVVAALCKLSHEPSLLASLGSNARARYEGEFRVERMVAEYFGFWEVLASARFPR